LGTQTANIIHQAILDKNIKKFDPMIWYDKYDDEYSDEYY
jgi:hypothetical protein